MIDTPEKRRMAIDFGKGCGTGMPVPQGMTSVSERAHILNLFYEISIVPPSFFWRNKNRILGTWTTKTTVATSWAGKSSPSTPWVGRTPPPDGSTQTL